MNYDILKIGLCLCNDQFQPVHNSSSVEGILKWEWCNKVLNILSKALP